MQSGDVLSDLPVGNHVVEFNLVEGWSRPANKACTVHVSHTTIVQAVYGVNTGAVGVTIKPGVAVGEGARWQVDGGQWLESGMMQSGLGVGSHLISFSMVSGWETPSDMTVMVENGKLTSVEGWYGRNQAAGSISCNLSPSTAVDAGALWKVSGGPWLESGQSQTGLLPGSHTVSFFSVPGWNPPADMSVSVTENGQVDITGTYQPVNPVGSVSVALNPSGACNDGAMWKLNDGPWRQSGYLESDVSEGGHEVFFNSIDGWQSPPSMPIDVIAGKVARISADYTPQSGSLTILIDPESAREAGARWRLLTGPWRASGDIAEGISPGAHTVLFKAVYGHETPEALQVTVMENQTVSGTGTYIVKSRDGFLSVVITPSEAVDQGAGWNVDGGPWLASGQLAEGLSPGIHAVDFKTVPGWSRPASRDIMIHPAQTTVSPAVYSRSHGALTVTLEPAEARNQGAQWQVQGRGFKNSGEREDRLEVGDHLVSFKNPDGWIKPQDMVASIKSGVIANLSVTFSKDIKSGALKVNLTPPEAIGAGARWKVGAGPWRESGFEETGLSPGAHSLYYQDIPGWTAPAGQSVIVAEEQTLVVEGQYTRKTGSVLVDIGPADAMTDGARWSLDRAAWNLGGVQIDNVPTGQYTITFNDVTGWIAPGSRPIAVLENQVSEETVIYSRRVGSVQVTINPSEAVSDGARWSLDGGGWNENRDRLDNIAIGDHAVSFEQLPGWIEPSSQTITVLEGKVAEATGSYARRVGSVQVTISPVEAVSDGAKWSLDGGGLNESGDRLDNVAIGVHSVSFEQLAGWIEPRDQSITVLEGQVARAAGNYESIAGSLRVLIKPAEAVTAGARWSLDGETWYPSGQRLDGLPVGEYGITFENIADWTAPSDQTVMIVENQLLQYDALYEEVVHSAAAVDLDISTLQYSDNVDDRDIESSVAIGASSSLLICLVAQNVTDLDTYQVELYFDPARIQLLNAAEDYAINGIYNILKKNGGQTIGFQATEPVPGTVNIANSLVGQDCEKAPEGSGVLAVLMIKVLDDLPDNFLTLGNVFYIDCQNKEHTVSLLSEAVLNPDTIGDFNGDRIVNFLDLGMFADHWLLTEDSIGWEDKYNLNSTPERGRQVINFFDLGTYADHWLEKY